MIGRLTLFYNDKKKLAGDPNPFDFRYDTQILPFGSVGVGFMVADPEHPGMPKELLEPGYMTDEQEQSWVQLVRDARTLLILGYLPEEEESHA